MNRDIFSASEAEFLTFATTFNVGAVNYATLIESRDMRERNKELEMVRVGAIFGAASLVVNWCVMLNDFGSMHDTNRSVKSEEFNEK